MDITPLTPKEKLRIRSYGTGVFHINDVRYAGNVALTPDAAQDFSPKTLSEIDAQAIRALPPAFAVAEVLLIGAGKRYSPLPKEPERAFALAGMAPEVMDVGAACRTYNVLLSEGRNVAALLFALTDGD